MATFFVRTKTMKVSHVQIAIEMNTHLKKKVDFDKNKEFAFSPKQGCK